MTLTTALNPHTWQSGNPGLRPHPRLTKPQLLRRRVRVQLEADRKSLLIFDQLDAELLEVLLHRRSLGAAAVAREEVANLRRGAREYDVDERVLGKCVAFAVLLCQIVDQIAQPAFAAGELEQPNVEQPRHHGTPLIDV